MFDNHLLLVVEGLFLCPIRSCHFDAYFNNSPELYWLEHLFLCRVGRLENGKARSSNLKFENGVVLLDIEECDSSKLSPSDNQHFQLCFLITKEGRI